MTTMNEHIDMGEFDREYSLAELFPLSLAKVLLADINGRAAASILYPDGKVYYPADGDGATRKKTANRRLRSGLT
ncbi:hypothetical protein [Desulfosarcina cetonica]|uniref:hypothetical protein n=1 Tax=Desulfosarcina cetonica TaxID=90730 RepID=UPI0006CFC060|nr:hypothetical protein [Desulfosarcina cetonica]